MTSSEMITGPTFEEMLHPQEIDPAIRERAIQARTEDPLDPINLFNISWRDSQDHIYYDVLAPEFTGVQAPIVVLYAKDFPTGSHKVGAAYSVLIEKELRGEVDPRKHALLWPSTGNYGIGGAWVGSRMNFDSVVVMPRGMSQERFRLIEGYGARVARTPGSESNVKEVYEKCQALKAADPERVRIMNQFEAFGNYRFHYHVTGNTIVELAEELAEQDIGDGTVTAYVSAMGSGGTIAAGDRVKQAWPNGLIVGLEPIQCPTLSVNGYGSHDIQGIGDKHVTWIHNVFNTDAIMAIDDIESKKGLQLITEEAGWRVMIDRYGVPEASVRRMANYFGISGICNVLGAIKTAKYYDLGRQDVIVTVCTDAIDRYGSVMAEMTEAYGPMDETEAAVRLVSIFHRQKTDWVQEGTYKARQRWHNLKHFTWVEQQGKSVKALDAQRDPAFWAREQAGVKEIDQLLREYRASHQV